MVWFSPFSLANSKKRSKTRSIPTQCSPNRLSNGRARRKLAITSTHPRSQRLPPQAPDAPDIEKVRLKDGVLNSVKSNEMTPYYETLIADKVVELDQSVLDLLRAKNEDEIKKLDEKIADAEENLGESEVREAHLTNFLYYIRISEKEKALEQLKVMEIETIVVGQKMDLVFYTLQIGFFLHGFRSYFQKH